MNHDILHSHLETPAVSDLFAAVQEAAEELSALKESFREAAANES